MSTNLSTVVNEKSQWTTAEKAELDLCESGRCFVKMTQCMICMKDQIEHSNLQLRSVEYYLYSSNELSNVLIYCQECKKKGEYVYLNELLQHKKIPSKKPLFSYEVKLKVIRSNGSEDVGRLMPRMKLGWSTTMKEITALVLMEPSDTNPGTEVVKPLALSLLFQANPEVRDFPEFKNGLVIPLEHEEMLKVEFPDFYAKIQKSISDLNQKFFSDRAC